KEQEVDSPPVEEQPIEQKQENAAAITEEQPIETKPVEEAPQPKVGRFQSLKARYQKQEQTYPTEVPEQLSE
ncbi:MAG: hypothetical protein CV045_10765, partial [Cyanobacteria bacterium M5B4]